MFKKFLQTYIGVDDWFINLSFGAACNFEFLTNETNGSRASLLSGLLAVSPVSGERFPYFTDPILIFLRSNPVSLAVRSKELTGNRGIWNIP